MALGERSKPVALKIADLRLWGEEDEDGAPPHTDEIRKCIQPGCITILNGFNFGDKCLSHQDAKVDPEFLSKLGAPPEAQMELCLIGLAKKGKGERRLIKVRKRTVMPGQEQLFLPASPDWESASTGDPSVDKLVRSVAARFGSTISEVISGSHKQSASEARAVILWELCKLRHITVVMKLLNVRSQGNACTLRKRGEVLAAKFISVAVAT